MAGRELLRDPVWQGEELGEALPDSPHAVSVALPRWQDVVGYEEKWPEVVDRLKSGYPRFVIHRLVRELARQAGGECPCLVFPSAETARLCVDFIVRQSGAGAVVLPQGDVWGVATSVRGVDALKAFWQHTGLIVSTRQAEAELSGRGSGKGEGDSYDSLRSQIASLYDCAADDVFLQPTGMAAMFAALRVVRSRMPSAPTAQIGFPYVDTLKLQEKFGCGVTLLHDLEHCSANLRKLLLDAPLAGCFCELPGNPLLGSADLREITPVLREHGVPLVADDVVATPLNVDLSGHADLIATSLTKYIVGSGDAMGGALICNPRSPYYAELKRFAAGLHEELLWHEDAAVLATNIADFPHRMRRHNANGLIIAERLRRHPLVAEVWYPKWSFGEAYEAVRRPDGGWGGLVTFLPQDAETASPRIYDSLAVCKGPSLGTTFTLACPFTLLAHYTELAWAESCGVPRNLIRISVGLEDPEDLWQRIARALENGASNRIIDNHLAERGGSVT
ncbi:MAG TPA: PLP-dependent transferase [Geobacteraceae bacterium]